MKDIIIIANFNRLYSLDDYGRFTHLAFLLSKNNAVEIVTSSFDHIAKRKKSANQIIQDFKITQLPEIGYRKNISIKRFRSHYLWGKEVRRYLQKREKPDIVYCAMPSLTAARYAASFCRKNNVPFYIDVQDLWPEAFQIAFNVPIVSNIVFYPFKLMADYAYKRADKIIAVSETYLKRAKQVNKNAPACVVYLGNRIEDFDRYAHEYRVPKDENQFWIGYCGTLGSSYDITVILEALCLLDDRRFVFHIMGDGPRLLEFKQKAEALHVNAIFHGRLEYPKMCGFLSQCDVAVNPITHGAAQSIINKHSDYAAAGIPVINTQECREYIELVKQYRMGFNCKNGDPTDVSNRLRELFDNRQLCRQMGRNARRCAEEKFDRRRTYLCLSQMIQGEQ